MSCADNFYNSIEYQEFPISNNIKYKESPQIIPKASFVNDEYSHGSFHTTL